MIKKPNLKWLPRTLEALAPWFANFALKFAQFAGELGFDADEVTAVTNDNLVVQWLLDAEHAFEANLDGFRSFRDETLYAEKNDPAPAEPVTVLPAAPALFTTAIIERLVNLVERIRLSDKYTPEIGEQLGITGSESDSIAPENWKPVLKVKALPNYQVQVEFVRGDASGILLESEDDGADTWSEIGKFFGSPAVFTVNGGAPKALNLRGRLLQKNDPVGDYSDTVQIVTTP
jgi:hypothetical protein